MTRWTLRGATTSYVVEVPSHGQWASLVAWGPHAVADGPSLVAPVGTEHFLPRADVEPLEYGVKGVRYTGAPDLVVTGSDGSDELRPLFVDSAQGDDSLELTFLDELRAVRVVLHYRMPVGLDVVERWVSVHNDGADELR
ncbi:MAG: alpha-galactosidase, partial [Kribbellaceae bacterium]|nr:alpha-galactosidase [Kribbellaceae bacterium]